MPNDKNDVLELIADIYLTANKPVFPEKHTDSVSDFKKLNGALYIVYTVMEEMLALCEDGDLLYRGASNDYIQTLATLESEIPSYLKAVEDVSVNASKYLDARLSVEELSVIVKNNVSELGVEGRGKDCAIGLLEAVNDFWYVLVNGEFKTFKDYVGKLIDLADSE